MAERIPVIDIFAGPGGLAEGFAASKSNSFDIKLSIENNSIAIETLKLRKFFRSFKDGCIPEDYYRYIRGEISRTVLEQHPEWQVASKKALNLTLGSESDRTSVHRTIAAALGKAKDFVLIGGPPCQAYSLVGRSRMTGIGKLSRARLSDKAVSSATGALLQRFHADARHTLYRAYLEILTVHAPAIFVMENVKGILSSRLKLPDGSYENTFERILSDLEDPYKAVAGDLTDRALTEVRPRKVKYRLFPLTPHEGLSSDLFGSDKAWSCPKDFIVRSEDYGVPQRRHRVIVLGIREDITRLPGTLNPREQITVHDAISDLPNIRSRISPLSSDTVEKWIQVTGNSAKEISRYLRDDSARQKLSRIQNRQMTSLSCGSRFIATKSDTQNSTTFKKWVHDKRILGVIQHESRSHMPEDLKRYLYLSTAASVTPSSDRGCLTLDKWPAELLPAHDNVIKSTGNLSSIVFKDRFRVQHPNEPSTTITSHISKDGHYFIHYSPMQCRSLTVREAARLQTFPDNYFFEGGRTDQFKQVGNAVPPFLAWQIANLVKDILRA